MLRNENEALKNDRATLSGNLQELENKFADFYAGVEDEVALQRENERLQLEEHSHFR